MKKYICFILTLLLAMVLFAGCALFDPNLDVLEYSMVVADASELEQLEVYANLQKLDLRGSDCYGAIEDYIAAHPQVEVAYDVKVGNSRYSPEVEQLKLEDGTYELEQLLTVLKHLPALKSLELPKTSQTVEAISSILEVYPALDVHYTVELMGEEVTPDLTELDLSGIKPAELDENLFDKLRLLPALTTVYLMDSEGNSQLAPADVKILMNVLPEVAFDYSFQLFGQTVSTADERVEFVEVDIGNEGIPEIRAALDILPNCTYFLMDDCGVDNEVMAQLRDDYPDTKVVWRVYWGTKYHDLTDVEMICCNGNMDASNMQALKYCTDVVYLDIGHSTRVTDIDFINYMPKLKIAILLDCRISTLEPFRNCPDLEWIEIVRCMRLTDISPLASCTKLRGINMSCAYLVTDITPLFGLQNLERLYLGRTSTKIDQYYAACEALPNCWVTRTWYAVGLYSANYSVGWRLDEDMERSDFYNEFRRIFRYDEGFYNGNPDIK